MASVVPSPACRGRQGAPCGRSLQAHRGHWSTWAAKDGGFEIRKLGSVRNAQQILAGPASELRRTRPPDRPVRSASLPRAEVLDLTPAGLGPSRLHEDGMRRRDVLELVGGAVACDVRSG